MSLGEQHILEVKLPRFYKSLSIWQIPELRQEGSEAVAEGEDKDQLRISIAAQSSFVIPHPDNLVDGASLS